jgi:hypothetical protein
MRKEESTVQTISPHGCSDGKQEAVVIESTARKLNNIIMIVWKNKEQNRDTLYTPTYQVAKKYEK